MKLSLSGVRRPYGFVNPLTGHSRCVAFVSDCSITSSFFCKVSKHVGEHSGGGTGCFASDGSGKICGVLCGVRAGLQGGVCLLAQLLNSTSEIIGSSTRCSCLGLSIFYGLISGYQAPVFNHPGGSLRIYFLSRFRGITFRPLLFPMHDRSRHSQQ